MKNIILYLFIIITSQVAAQQRLDLRAFNKANGADVVQEKEVFTVS